MRVIVRRERPHPGAQLSLFEDRDGWRYTAFATNTTHGSLQWLEVRHRTHARVEDRIRCAKNTGLRRLPSREFAINQAWCTAAAIAADLIAWLQLLALDGDRPGRTETAALPHAHRRPPGPRTTPPPAPHPLELALGRPDHRRLHPDRGHPAPG
jgi:Transposase DDE domain group 1